MLALALCVAPLAARAGECRPQVRDGWIRKPPAELPMMAGYARVVNACDRAVVLTAASSPAFSDASLHATVVEGGISRMRALGELRISANRTATFEPGGMHLMLMQPRKPLRDGDLVPIDFTLADGSRLRGEFQVRTP